jgi:hypothetical protein
MPDKIVSPVTGKLLAPRCGTIGCRNDATHTLTYSFPESRDVIETDEVCAQCGEDYLRRPALKASLAEGISQSTIGSQEEKGTDYVSGN